MRSRIGTKSRLAAHLTALALLILLLTQVDPQPDSGSGVFSPIPVPAAPAVQEPADAAVTAPVTTGTTRPAPDPVTPLPSPAGKAVSEAPAESSPAPVKIADDSSGSQPAEPSVSEERAASTKPTSTVPIEATLSSPDEPELTAPVESGALRPPSVSTVKPPLERTDPGQIAEQPVLPVTRNDEPARSETSTPPLPAVQPPQPVEPVIRPVDETTPEPERPSSVIPTESVSPAYTADSAESLTDLTSSESIIAPMPSIPDPELEAELVSPDDEMDLLGAVPDTEAVIDAAMLSAEPAPTLTEVTPDLSANASSPSEPIVTGDSDSVDDTNPKSTNFTGDSTDEEAANTYLAADSAMVIPDEAEEYLSEQSTSPNGNGTDVEAVPTELEKSENDSGDDMESPATAQPDESGSLVVAEQETAANGVPVLAPLPDHPNLEVLGDGVYWLSSRYDFDTELEAIPETSAIVVLTPLPEFSPHYPGYKQVVAIPADTADISRDSADHFLYLTGQASPAAPVVVAALANARGAAFYKGLYLLRHRDMSYDAMVEAIQPELEDAGPAKNEILHRLFRSLQE